jgi:peptide/nickel transport system permease protein
VDPAGGPTLIRYAGRRVLQAIPLLVGIVTLIFFVLHLAPGDPTSTWLNPSIPPEALERMRENMGVDQPVLVQYVKWIKSFASGDFGYSYSQFRPVSAVIADHLPNTLLLSVVSLILIFGLGSAIGAVQAVRRNSALDDVLTFTSLLVYSMPGFWFGLMLILLVSSGALPDFVRLPISGMTDVDHSLMTPWKKVVDVARHLVLPSIALGVASAAGIARYVRGELLEVLDQDYIRTARAKGLAEWRILFKHALRNAMIPVISLLGLHLPILIGGALVIEVVFSWPGMGRLMYDAVFARDYPLVMASSFLFAVVVVAGNLLADLLYAAADPRIRHE